MSGSVDASASTTASPFIHSISPADQSLDKPFLLFVTYGALLSAYTAVEAGYESLRFFREPDVFLGTVTQAPAQYPNGTLVCLKGHTCEGEAALAPDVIVSR